ncbi:MAG: hypothetical protein WD534_17655 [Phycisphaeraceae bacterium]
MLSRQELPEDAANWTTVQVCFDRLAPDREEACPIAREEVMNYVRMESADTDSAEEASLLFLRTARIGEASYWLWSYTESDGVVCFVTCRQNDDGSNMLSLAEPNGLSPEQYLLADYYDEIYWS